jgi:hypothetical protein
MGSKPLSSTALLVSVNACAALEKTNTKGITQNNGCTMG